MGRIKYEPAVLLKKTLSDLVKKWPLMLLVIFIDIAFIFIFSFVYTLYFQKIISHATVIMQQTSSIAEALSTQDIYTAAPIAQSVAREIFQIKVLAVLLIISIFVIWIAFQAFNWKNCFSISGRKIKYMQYLKSFAVMSAIWTAIISFILYLSIQMFFAKAMTFSVSPGDASMLNIGMIIAFAVVGYFAIVSFSLSGKIKDVLKKTVLFSFLKSKVLVAYVFILIITAIADLIIFGLFRISLMLSLIIGIILVLLLFTYARVYMINVVQSLEENKVKKKRKN